MLGHGQGNTGPRRRQGPGKWFVSSSRAVLAPPIPPRAERSGLNQRKLELKHHGRNPLPFIPRRR